MALITMLALTAQAQDARELVRKSDELFRGQSSKSEMTMTIVRPNWTRDITMWAWSRGEDYSLILVLAPARDKGVAYLKRQKEVWNWQPSIERTIKLPPSMMSQSWMGSDFTNDDLVRDVSVVNDYSHKILGEETINGYPCYKIEMIPRAEAAIVWGKVVVWIAKDQFWQLKGEFYDEEGYLVNTMYASEITNLGGRQLPAKMEMIPEDNPGNKTMIRYHSIEFGADIPESFFTVQNMRTVR